MTTWPIIAGVMIIRSSPTEIPKIDQASPQPPPKTEPGRWLPLVPRRRGEPRLAVGKVVRPHDHALAVLPLEHRRLVRGLEPVRVDRVVAERVLRLELQQFVAHLLRVERPGAPYGFDVDPAPGVAGRCVIRGLALVLLLVRRDELLVPGIRERLVPLRGAVHVFRVL